LKNTFISQHNLTCPIISQAPENQQHKILWAAEDMAHHEAGGRMNGG
jgi:hypothetical protein